MTAEMIVHIAGVFNVLCGLLHLAFPKLLGWQKDLQSLNPINQATMKILNICLMLFWFVLGYLYLMHAPEVVGTGLGVALLVCMSIFWVVRAFLLQPVYLGLATRESKVMFIVFVVCLGLNLTPVIIVW